MNHRLPRPAYDALLADLTGAFMVCGGHAPLILRVFYRGGSLQKER